jgi:two-component system LytT family response regulator
MNAPLNVLIVDDERLARDIIRNFLHKYENLVITGESSSGLQAIEAIETLKPDLVFLDVQMPDLNGFQIIKEVERDFKGLFVFTTAYNHYAVAAFETSAVDYLLKPFSEERFDSAVQKALKHLAAYKVLDAQKTVDQLLSAYHELSQKEGAKKYLQRLLVRESKKLFMVSLKEVYYLEASGDYVKVHQHHKTHLVNESLNSLEKQLDPAQFLRIHRSYIVNLDYIKEFIPYFNSEYILVLENNAQVKLSRSYKNLFKDLIGRQL